MSLIEDTKDLKARLALLLSQVPEDSALARDILRALGPLTDIERDLRIKEEAYELAQATTDPEEG